MLFVDFLLCYIVSKNYSLFFWSFLKHFPTNKIIIYFSNCFFLCTPHSPDPIPAPCMRHYQVQIINHDKLCRSKHTITIAIGKGMDGMLMQGSLRHRYRYSFAFVCSFVCSADLPAGRCSCGDGDGVGCVCVCCLQLLCGIINHNLCAFCGN